LEAGGDDYLAKPFRLEEFLLRVHAILRRRLWLAAAEPMCFASGATSSTLARCRGARGTGGVTS
jgi:DNA-binding response OmpR family regulator